VNFADNEEKIFALSRIGIGGQIAGPDRLGNLERKDVYPGEENRI